MLLLLLLAACSGPTAPPPEPPSGGPMTMQPWTPPKMERGADLAPAEALVAWLDAGGDRLVRIPVVIARGEGGYQLGEAWIAGTKDAPPADAVRLRLSDSALGVSLHDRVEQYCPDRTAPCLLWLTGHWNGADTQLVVAGSGADTQLAVAGSDRYRFSIRHVDGVVEDGDEIGAFGEAR